MNSEVEPQTESPNPSRAGWMVRALLVALGFATLDLIWLLKPAVESTQRVAFHWSGTPSGLYLAAALDTLLLTALLLLLLLAARRGGKVRAAVWGGLLFFVPWIIYIDDHILLHHVPNRKLSWFLFWGALAAASWVSARWRHAFRPRFERVVDVATNVMSFVGLFGILLLCRLAWYGIEAHSLAERYPLHHAQIASAAQPHRIIWIVFDELSYRQVYEHRYPGLQLPAFDALAAQGTVFSHVVPVDIQTEVVLPGLMTGIPMDDIRTSPTGQFRLHNAQSRQWQPFDDQNTIFKDALDAGYGTAAAGWYNPYCRMIASVLDQCFWVYRGPVSNGMSISSSVTQNMLGTLNELKDMLVSAGPYKLQLALANYRVSGSGLPDSGLHIKDFQDLDTAALKLVADPDAGLVLLHFPIPHPTGIYDRTTGVVKPAGSYVDNLALADRTLAELRATLEKQGQWDSSTVIVMGDHGWRTQLLWFRHRTSNLWTEEDAAASEGGVFDDRPAYVIKLPGQSNAARVDSAFHAINTRALLDGVLAKKLQTSADVSTFATQAK